MRHLKKTTFFRVIKKQKKKLICKLIVMNGIQLKNENNFRLIDIVNI